MLKKPGVKTKEGLQVSGIYGLILALLGNTLFPDISSQDVLNTVQEVSAWYKSTENADISTIISNFLNLTVVGYLVNRLKK